MEGEVPVAEVIEPGKNYSLDNIDLSTYSDDPKQPRKTDKQKELKKFILENLKELKVGKEEAKFSDAEIEEIIANLEYIYGGETRFYQRFLIARNRNMKKTQKMVKSMLEIRFKIVGRKMVTSVTTSKDFFSDGAEDKELFAEIYKQWPVELYGFTADQYPMILARLQDITPGEFMKKFKKDDVKRFYFYFMERARILERLANSLEVHKEKKKAVRYFEIYDLGGMSRKQYHISGLRYLADILKIGQVPWFFSACWALVSKVLNQASVNKITIDRKDAKEDLMKLVGGEKELEMLWNHAKEKAEAMKEAKKAAADARKSVKGK